MKHTDHTSTMVAALVIFVFLAVLALMENLL